MTDNRTDESAYSWHTSNEMVSFQKKRIAALEAANKELREALTIQEQFLVELGHAREAGVSWYTKGEGGRNAQVNLWFNKALKAIADLRRDAKAGGA